MQTEGTMWIQEVFNPEHIFHQADQLCPPGSFPSQTPRPEPVTCSPAQHSRPDNGPTHAHRKEPASQNLRGLPEASRLSGVLLYHTLQATLTPFKTHQHNFSSTKKPWKSITDQLNQNLLVWDPGMHSCKTPQCPGRLGNHRFPTKPLWISPMFGR